MKKDLVYGFQVYYKFLETLISSTTSFVYTGNYNHPSWSYSGYYEYILIACHSPFGKYLYYVLGPFSLPQPHGRLPV